MPLPPPPPPPHPANSSASFARLVVQRGGGTPAPSPPAIVPVERRVSPACWSVAVWSLEGADSDRSSFFLFSSLFSNERRSRMIEADDRRGIASTREKADTWPYAAHSRVPTPRTRAPTLPLRLIFLHSPLLSHIPLTPLLATRPRGWLDA